MIRLTFFEYKFVTKYTYLRYTIGKFFTNPLLFIQLMKRFKSSITNKLLLIYVDFSLLSKIGYIGTLNKI